MKKQIILAALCAAVLASPFVNAKSGFSSGRSSGKPSGFSSKPSSSFRSVSAPKASPAAPRPSYAPANVVTPRVATPVVAAAPAPVSAPVKSGFSTGLSSNTQAKIAGGVGATAVGGALYAAHANQAAVAAYDSSRKSPEAPAIAQSGGERSTVAAGAQGYSPSTPSYHPAPQPQVIVVQQQAPSSGHEVLAGVIGYELGRHNSHRDAWGPSHDYGRAAQQVPAGVTPVNTPQSASSGSFALFLIVLSILALFGLAWYLMFRRSDVAKSRQVKAPSSNSTYTL